MQKVKYRLYAWTLFELIAAKESFDVIFLDGHHTFYIDLPAMFLCDRLLRLGGVLMLDDIEWNLPQVEQNMYSSFPEWVFYHSIYSSLEYTQSQKQLPHMQLMAEKLFIDGGAYRLLTNYSTHEWWVLRKNE